MVYTVYMVVGGYIFSNAYSAGSSMFKCVKQRSIAATILNVQYVRPTPPTGRSSYPRVFQTPSSASYKTTRGGMRHIAAHSCPRAAHGPQASGTLPPPV